MEGKKETMRTLFLKERVLYDGSQLHSHWAYKNYSLLGDSVVAFIGPCEVKKEEMVDLEDFLKGEVIRAEEMLHFICEHFGLDLRETVYRQRLLIVCAKEALEERGLRILRVGDDLFYNQRKLSISIATITPLSGKIHLGINIDPRGAPLPAVGLKEIGIEPVGFGEEVMRRYKEEIEGIHTTMYKVKGVP